MPSSAEGFDWRGVGEFAGVRRARIATLPRGVRSDTAIAVSVPTQQEAALLFTRTYHLPHLVTIPARRYNHYRALHNLRPSIEMKSMRMWLFYTISVISRFSEILSSEFGKMEKWTMLELRV